QRRYRQNTNDQIVFVPQEPALVFTDSRQFGRVRFHHGADEPNWWKSDAPEIKSRAFDQKFVDRFLGRHRKAPIKAVLLMQNGFPGIGNWMADEILWRAETRRLRRTARLSVSARVKIFHSAKPVVWRLLENVGTA